MELMRVKFVRSVRRWKRGDIQDLFSNVAKVYIKRGICVPVLDEPETAMVAPARERAVRRRGRPRKVIQ